jgi:hypothetical protein
VDPADLALADLPQTSAEKRVPLNHQIVARLMGRQRSDEKK